MQIKSMMLFVITVNTLFFGCASSTNENTLTHPRKTYRYIINKIPSYMKIALSPAHTLYRNGLPKVIIPIENYSENTKYDNLEYRFRWFSKRGFEVGKDLAIWKPLTLLPQEKVQLTALAPTPYARKYRFHIRQREHQSDIKRVDPSSLIDTDISYSAEDLHLITDSLVSSMLKNRLFDGKPVITIGKIKNNTDENIDTKLIADSIKVILIKSKKAKFIDRNLRQLLHEELTYQNSSKYIDKKSATTFGKEIAPDYILTGSISTVKKTNDYFYKVILELHNFQNGTTSWIDSTEIRKRENSHEK